MSSASTERFTYEISWRALMLGIAGLVACLALLLALAIEGLPGGWLWWLMTSIVALALGLSVFVAVATRRVRPIEVILGHDAIEIPSGMVGTRRQSIAFEDVRGLRVVGRASLVRRDLSREVLYILYEERYSLLMSEMFTGWPAYVRCRDALIDRVRQARPDVRIDIDGRPLEDPRPAPRPPLADPPEGGG